MKTILILLFIFTTQIPWSYNTYGHMDKLNIALNYYYDDCGIYPTNSEGLSELLNSTKDCWNGPYATEKMLVDRVTRKKYQYEFLTTGYVVTSAGMDGFFKTDDDFRSSDNELFRTKIINKYIKEENHKKLIKKSVYVVSGLLILLFFIWVFHRFVLSKRPRK